MGRTINGKNFTQVIKELSAPFEEKLFKTDNYGHPYLPVEQYEMRMNEVVGILNYDTKISPPVINIIGTRPHVSLMGSITIYDDDGKAVVSKEAPGACTVIFSNQTKEAVALKNDQESAAKDAFKRCCKKLGIANSQMKKLNSSQLSNDNSDEPAGPITLYRITLKEKFSTVGKDGYKALVHVEGESAEMQLLIWKDAQDKIAEIIPIEKFISLYQPGKSFSLYAYKKVFRPKSGKPVEQLIMDGPYVNERED